MRQVLDDFAEQRGRYRQIVSGAGCVVEELPQRRERPGFGIIAVDVAQQLHESFECGCIERAVLLDAFAGARLQLFELPTALGDANDRNIERAAL